MTTYRLFGSRLLATVSMIAVIAVSETFEERSAKAGGPEAIDLISPANCQSEFGSFVGCKIPSRVVHLATFESAVPLRTLVKRVRAGNCTTQYPLQIGVTVRGDATI